MLETFKTPNLVIRVTEDRELAKTDYYQSVIDIVEQLSRQGAIYRMSGHCVATCDLLQHLLYDQGIESRIIEVQVTVSRPGPQNQLPRFSFIGYDRFQNNREIDTHVVVVTDTEIPVLIDLSIVDHLTVEHPLIIERAEVRGDRVGDYQWPDLHVTYKVKKIPRFPQINNQNLIARMIKDQQLRRNIRWLNIMVTLALIVASLNAVRGAYDFYMVYVEDNNWGPRTMEEIKHKVIELEKKVDQQRP